MRPLFLAEARSGRDFLSGLNAESLSANRNLYCFRSVVLSVMLFSRIYEEYLTEIKQTFLDLVYLFMEAEILRCNGRPDRVS